MRVNVSVLALRFQAIPATGFLFTLLAALMGAGCQRGPEPLTAEAPLHLEDHLDAARLEGSEIPDDIPSAVEWRFDEPQPDWKPVVPLDPTVHPVQVARTEDAMRLTLVGRSPRAQATPLGGVYVGLPDWRREDWGSVLVQARTSALYLTVRLLYDRPESTTGLIPFGRGPSVPLITDGSVQSYLLDPPVLPVGPWRQLGIWASRPGSLPPEAGEPPSLDILSVKVIPKAAPFATAPVGVRSVARGGTSTRGGFGGRSAPSRRALYVHTPARLDYPLRVPPAGRLDVGLGVIGNEPVTFRISARRHGGEAEALLEETYADPGQWAQRSLDLSSLSGQTVTLTLEAAADRSGTVALWAAPTLSGARTSNKPNVIFYVIDGAGADYMSVYGYNRRTTPNLERIAAEGAVFEHAYSNSTWTKPSTPSFMTSLHNSVLGGYRSDSDPLPDRAVTMAQHLHTAGYQTAVFTTNAYAGRLSSLDRGVDVIRDTGVQVSESSVALHEDFWQWRETYPGEPYWVHFQTTDVHWRRNPPAPFAGLFLGPEQREIHAEWDRELVSAAATWLTKGRYSAEAFEKTGISRVAHFNSERALYNETMAHNDMQIGQLVDRLKAVGEWEHTLLIVAADHGEAASLALGLRDLPPARWGPYFTSVTRIPLIVVWPEHIAPGQRFSDPVSMIDVLPTILDLLDLPLPEVMQGQSLAPLLLGEEGWETRPVIFDEFNADRPNPSMPNLGPGEISGQIEVIDGRWGASLAINPDVLPPARRRPVPLLLYDVWNDPECLHSLHEERPDLVEKYTAFLEAQWEAHQALAQHFSRSEDSPLTPEQLRMLRSLGYIQ